MRFLVVSSLIALSGMLAGLSIESSRAQTGTDWQTVEIKADEYSFTPNRIQAKAHRPLELVVINEGHEPHQFRSSLFKNQMIEVHIGENIVRGRGIEIVDIASGATARIKLLSPPPGQFDFQCRIPSHHGMDGIMLIETER